ncbi:glycosyl transferase family 2 [Gloeothece citriformis PCC 7424]|uniref:Glycosyl transferase family 2 n=2 Tax=Gloeothece TaxID=28070 RepID=B7KDV9_GLOC7|nr:glycosyl transferase family 2 [Gloeothece citriformis PCC 7424]
MIVKNEEASLTQCLESVKDVVDEMIVLDTGSSDKTVEIAQTLGAKVFYFEWSDDFSAARNEALKYVTGDWVLILDADEVLNPKIIPHLRQAISYEKNLVVNLIRQEIGATQSPYSLVSRLFRTHRELKFTRPYHAIIDDSVIQLLKKEPNWKIVELSDIAIFHYGYQPGVIASLDKTNRAKKAMEQFLGNAPNDPYVCSKLGALYLQIGQEKEGIKLLKQGLKSNQASPQVLFELHYHLGNAYTRQSQLERAVKHYQKAMNQPILPQLKIGAYHNTGSLLLSLGDLNNALKAYETTLNIDPNFAVGYYNLGMTLKAMGKLPEALAAYQKAITLAPDYASAYQNLGIILFKTGKIPESIESFKKAINLHETQNRPQEAQKLRQGLKEIGIIV